MGASSRFIALFAILGSAGAAFAACSSSDTSSESPDSGGTAGSDATTMSEGAAPATGKDAAGGSDDGGGGADGDAGAPVDSSSCPVVDVSVATVDAGPLWACLESACMPELTACAADCVCNDALLVALLCAAGGTSPVTCFTNAIQQNLGDFAVVGVGTCLQTNALACLAVSEGGTDAGADAVDGQGGRSDGGQEGGPDASTDGGSEGSSDASGGSSDGAAGDSPSGG